MFSWGLLIDTERYIGRALSVIHIRGITAVMWSLVSVVPAAFVLPQTLLTDAARYFVQALGAFYSATPGVSLLDKRILNNF